MDIRWYVTEILIYVFMMDNDVEHFSCVYWPFVYLLWKNVYSDSLPIFSFPIFFFTVIKYT